MTSRRPVAVLMAALAAGCGGFPQADTAADDAAMPGGYPALVPVEELRAAAAPRPWGTRATVMTAAARAPEPAAAIDARAARLKARAARLRGGSVIDPETKDRLDSEIGIEEEDDDI